MKAYGKLAGVLLGVVCVLAFFVGLGSYPLLDPGDGYFAEASREMLRRGELVVPYLNGQIYFSKPIMIYWLIMASYKVLGVSEFAARLPSALLASGSVLLTFAMAQRVKGMRAGMLAALVLASSPLFCTFGRMCLVDMAFTSWLTAALAATLFTLSRGGGKQWIWIYVALAAAVLTKGPAALVMFAGAIAFFAVVQRISPRALFSELRVLPGLAITAVLSVPWFVAVGLATDWLWPKVFLLFENLGRFEGETNHVNRNPFFYLIVLAYGLFPWTMIAPGLLPWLRRQVVDNRLICLLACWVVAVVGAFTLSSTKLQTYILPAFPAIAVLLGVAIDGWLAAALRWRRSASSRSFAIAANVLGAFGVVSLVVAAFLAVSLATGFFPLPDPGLTANLKAASAVVLLICGVLAVGQMLLHHRGARPAWARGFVLANCAFVVLTVGVVFEVAYDYAQLDLHRAIQPLIGHDWSNADVAIYQHFKPGTMFYLEHSVDSFFHSDALVPVANGERFTQYVLATDKQAPDLVASTAGQMQPVSQSGHWILLRSDTVRLKRLPTLEWTFRNNVSLSTKGVHWGTLPFAGAGRTL
jgi:4-amino-4-deoxy-L-arabinose transferase-like glycosyltransferase